MAGGPQAAPPGQSAHEKGMAIDLYPDQNYIEKMRPIMEANGWYQTAGAHDLGHFEYLGTQAIELTPEQKSQAGKLARELYGTIRTEAQIEQFIKPIEDRMRAGENIDEIADSLRFAGQSVAFTGAIRDAAQQITADWSEKKTQNAFDKLDDLLSKDNIVAVQDYLRKLALDDTGAEQAKMIMGQERTVEFLEEIAADLKDFEDKGGDTNIFTGTLEEASSKVGLVKEPALRKVAVKIIAARQKYRRSMTGVAFSPGENLEYDKVFPNINKVAEFNTAVIAGLQEAFEGDVDFFYGHKMGHDAYEAIFKGNINDPLGVMNDDDPLGIL